MYFTTKNDYGPLYIHIEPIRDCQIFDRRRLTHFSPYGNHQNSCMQYDIIGDRTLVRVNRPLMHPDLEPRRYNRHLYWEADILHPLPSPSPLN